MILLSTLSVMTLGYFMIGTRNQTCCLAKVCSNFLLFQCMLVIHSSRPFECFWQELAAHAVHVLRI